MASSPTILIVDDDEISRLLVTEQLKRRFGMAYNYLTVDSLPKALGAMEDLNRAGSALALVVTDWLMPDGMGDALIQAVQANNPNVPVALSSAQATGEELTKLQQLFPNLILLPKPWDGTTGLDRLKDALEASSS